MNPSPNEEYQAALTWLFSQTRSGAARSPERAARLLRRLELRAPELTVSVVGTNGKGSVSAMTAAGLTASGRVTGRFISPHVESFRERVTVDGEPLSEERISAFVRQARALLAAGFGDSGKRPAFFEWTLALALSEFTRQRAEAAVLEAGVGGASDATRAVEAVTLVVFTNVDLDHTEALGPTLEAITADKAGAIRPGVPVVSGVVQPELRAQVAAAAARAGAPLHQMDAGGANDALFKLPSHLESALARSPTRYLNARLAGATLRLLDVDEAAVTAGLRAPPLPGRGERFLLAGPPRLEVLLDGAHDPAAARRLLTEIGDRPYTLLFGALSRKQGSAVLEVLAHRAGAVVITEAQTGDGPVAHHPHRGRFVADPEAALEAAISANPEAGLLVVAGSLYLAGRIRPLLRERGERLQAPWEESPPRSTPARANV